MLRRFVVYIFLVAIVAIAWLPPSNANGWKSPEEYFKVCTSTPTENPRGFNKLPNPGFDYPKTNIGGTPPVIGKIDPRKIQDVCQTDNICNEDLSALQKRYLEYASTLLASCIDGRQDVALRCDIFKQECEEKGHELRLVAGSARLQRVRDAILAYELAAKQAAKGVGVQANGRLKTLLEEANAAEAARLGIEKGKWFEKAGSVGDPKALAEGSKYTPAELKGFAEKTNRVLSSISEGAAPSLAERQKLQNEVRQIPDKPLANALSTALTTDSNRIQAHREKSVLNTELAALSLQIQAVSKTNIDKKSLGSIENLSGKQKQTESTKFEVGKSIRDSGAGVNSKFNDKKVSGKGFAVKNSQGELNLNGGITNSDPSKRQVQTSKETGQTRAPDFTEKNPSGLSAAGAAEDKKTKDKDYSLKERLLAQLGRSGESEKNADGASAANSAAMDEAIPEAQFKSNLDKAHLLSEDHAIDAKPVFTLAGAETDAEINGLMAKMADKSEAPKKYDLASARDIGDENNSLFERIHNLHSRCQKSACVVK